MKRLITLLFLCFFTIIGTLKAQDLHYSMFEMSPLTLNPAYTGAFSGTARIGGLYRDQWSSITGSGNQFATPSIYIDSPIMMGFRKNDWVGLGFSMVYDRAGSLQLITSSNLFSASYHAAMDKKGKTMLTLGIQGGSVGRRIKNPNDVRFEDPDEILNVTSQGQGANQKETGSKKTYTDWSAGLMLKSQVSDKIAFEIGTVYAHALTPNYALSDSTDYQPPIGQPRSKGPNKRPVKLSAHGKMDVMLTDSWSLSPAFLFQTTAKHREVAVHAWAGNQINKDFKLNFGLGYRLGDAGEALLGANYKDVKVAMSYDINMSELRAVSNYRGGFEIAAWYIIKIYKKPETDPAILCPRF